MALIERECCLAVPDNIIKREIIAALSVNGFRTVGEAGDCFRFLREIRKVQPHLAVISADLPGNVNETASIIDQECLSALLIVANRAQVADRTLTNSFPVIYLPAETSSVAVVAGILCQEFSRRRKIFEENLMLKNKLKARTVIERAKGVIMEELSLEEHQAYRILQKRSMEKRLSMKELAEEILREKTS